MFCGDSPKGVKLTVAKQPAIQGRSIAFKPDSTTTWQGRSIQAQRRDTGSHVRRGRTLSRHQHPGGSRRHRGEARYLHLGGGEELYVDGKIGPSLTCR